MQNNPANQNQQPDANQQPDQNQQQANAANQQQQQANPANPANANQANANAANQQQQNPVAPGGGGGAPPPNPNFLLVPGSGVDVIDYTTREGISLFNAGSRTLFEDPADLFNVEAPGLQTFLSVLQHRANTSGWDLDVPQDLDRPHDDLLNLITHHGMFEHEHLFNFANSYVNHQSRAAQQNMMIVNCILASLSLPGFRKVQTWHEDWHVPSGLPAYAPLVKVIIREAYIDTQATTRILREHLSSLPLKLQEFHGDIDQLNAFVKVTVDQLAARDETTNDLLANLFKGYLSSSDSTFRHYIEKKQEDYDEGIEFNVNTLMALASNKYKTLLEAGKWMAPSEEQAKIIALESKITQLSKKTTSSTSTKATKAQGGTPPKRQKGKNGKKTYPAWMTKYPGKEFVEANRTKIVEGKKYWWCKQHKRFVMHQNSECKKLLSKEKSQNGSSGNQSSNSHQTNNSPSTPSIRVSTATMMDE